MRREIIRKGTRIVCACFVLVLLTYGNAEKYHLVSVMAALVFVLTSIIYAPPPPIPHDDSEILVVCEFNGPCTYFTTFIKCI